MPNDDVRIYCCSCHERVEAGDATCLLCLDEAEQEAASEAVEALQETVLDIERGIRTFDELLDEVRAARRER